MRPDEYRAWGIEPEYIDYRGERRDASEETLRYLRDAMARGSAEPPVLPLQGGGPLERCYLPGGLRTWGWAVQLYALRSRASWGMGDLTDLRTLVSDAASMDGVVLINPLHAVARHLPQEPSPYYASSRCFRNPLYLRVEEVPGAPELDDLEGVSKAGRALNSQPRIDRNEIYRLKMSALERLWARFPGDPAFVSYQKEMGAPLEDFAAFMALSEVHDGSWRGWPEDVRRPHSAAVSEFRKEYQRRVGFHAWLQWLLDEQSARASEEGHVVHDLAVGVDPDGADAWIWQDTFASGVTVGAPPDDYNSEGQDWAALPFDPWALIERDLEPFAYMLRCAMRHAAGLRIDHVMSFFRLFWIPDGAPPNAGAYVRYPHDLLLDAVARESEAHGCYVIGEDLGTVEPEMREELRKRRMLSYKLMWFEEDPPSHFPEMCMGGANTHDLPTTAGLWTGEDSKALQEHGLDPDHHLQQEIVRRLVFQIGVDTDTPVHEVVDRSYQALAASPSALVMGTLEDALEATERYNRPGTMGPWNWSAALPLPLEEILEHPRTRELVRMLADRR
jgi:4-alpha-glucanotransferase